MKKKYSDGSKSVVYGYDAAGNRVFVTKSAGEKTIIVTYNADEQVVSEKNSKAGDKIKYIYDENGNQILDASGFVVDIADPINGALYLLEGEYKNAGISFAATIPFVGSLGTTGRVAKTAAKVGKTGDKLSDIKIAGKITNEFLNPDELKNIGSPGKIQE